MCEVGPFPQKPQAQNRKLLTSEHLLKEGGSGGGIKINMVLEKRERKQMGRVGVREE